MSKLDQPSHENRGLVDALRLPAVLRVPTASLPTHREASHLDLDVLELAKKTIRTNLKALRAKGSAHLKFATSSLREALNGCFTSGPSEIEHLA